MSGKETSRNKVLTKMEEWNAGIDKLEARADRAVEGVQIECYQQLRRLCAFRVEVRTRLDEVCETGDAARVRHRSHHASVRKRDC